MSDDASSEPQSEPQQTSTSDSQPSEPQPGTTNDETPAPNEPGWAAGKSRDELIQQTQNLMNTLPDQLQNQSPPQQNPQPQAQAQQQQFAQRQQQLQQTPGYNPNQQTPATHRQQQAQAAQQGAQIGPPDPDVYYEDKNEYTRRWNQAVQAAAAQAAQQTVGQQAQPLLAAQAEMAKEHVKNDPSLKEVFEHYEPEIQAMMNGVPAQNKANPKAWRMAAETIRGRHFDELAKDHAERVAAGGANVTERSGTETAGGGTRSYRDSIAEFWHSDHPYVEQAKRNDLTEDDLRRRCRGMGRDPKEFVETIKQDEMIFSPTGTEITQEFREPPQSAEE